MLPGRNQELMRDTGLDDDHVTGRNRSLRSTVDAGSVGFTGADALRIDDLASEQEGRFTALNDHDVGMLIVDLYGAVFVTPFGGENVVIRRSTLHSLFGSDALFPDADSGRQIGRVGLEYPCCE